MKLLKLIFLFLIINFGALYLGSWLMNNEAASDWYMSLDKAPWTPQGWVFGAAWTIIMIFFSIYLGFLFNKKNNFNLQFLYIVQVFLNIAWNYIFFDQKLIGPALVTLLSLTFVIFYFFFRFKEEMKNLSYLLIPYMIWLLIATSLNGYIFLNN